MNECKIHVCFFLHVSSCSIMSQKMVPEPTKHRQSRHKQSFGVRNVLFVYNPAVTLDLKTRRHCQVKDKNFLCNCAVFCKL